MKEIEVRDAYTWDCEECGREIFDRVTLPEMSPEVELALRMAFDVGLDEPGDFMMMRRTLKCPHCGGEFLAKYPGEEQEE